MGEDFNFEEWSDTWTKTSGVNVLAPVLEYNDNGSVKSFAIKQTCDLRG
jgi:aminopeptidase N